MTATILAEEITRTTTGEAVQFWVLGVVAVLGALGVVAAPKAVYSAICLATTMMVLAIFYVAQGALFLGVVQVVVYTGAVMMLFIFVLMLIGIDSKESLRETLRGQRLAAAGVAIGFGALLIAGIGNASLAAVTGPMPVDDPAAAAASSEYNVEAIAHLIFVDYLWAFELTGGLLIAATLGAMVLAHRERFGARLTQREMSIARFRGGDDQTPLPSPGVYARRNSVETPARLPDGSESDLSVSDTRPDPEPGGEPR